MYARNIIHIRSKMWFFKGPEGWIYSGGLKASGEGQTVGEIEFIVSLLTYVSRNGFKQGSKYQCSKPVSHRTIISLISTTQEAD